MYVCRCILRPGKYMFLGASSLRSLAYISYNFFCWYIWGACPPPPIPKSWLRCGPSLQKWLPFFSSSSSFFFFLLACQLFPPESEEWTLFRWGFFFFFFFFWGGGLVSSKFWCPLRKPKPPPQCPPTEKNPSYATVEPVRSPPFFTLLRHIPTKIWSEYPPPPGSLSLCRVSLLSVKTWMEET